MKRDGLASWLTSRGWQYNYYAGTWNHPGLPKTAGGLKADDAFQVQTRRDHDEAARARGEAIRRADTGMDDDYRRAAIAAIRRVAERQFEFTSDDVLAEDPALEQAREPRALGVAMLYAAAEGWIVSTDRYGRSHRSQSHARAKRVWVSLIHHGRSPRPDRTAAMDVIEAVR